MGNVMRDALDMGSAVVMTWSEFYFCGRSKGAVGI